MNLSKKKLDFWSILEGLEEMTEYDIDVRSGYKTSEYYWEYEEVVNELAQHAALLYEEFQSIRQTMWMNLPAKNLKFCEEDDCTRTEIAWWNTAACMLTDVDMRELLESENNYSKDYEREKEKRVNALKSLTKDQNMYLYTTVIGFITRYLDLKNTFDVVMSVIDALDEHQAIMKQKSGELIIPQAAYIA